MNKIGIIVSGGSIEKTCALSVLESKNAEVIIAVDRGLEFLHREGIVPTHIVGDFDSIDQNVILYYKRETSIPIREFNPVKDASDTEIAIRMAIDLGVKELWIIGGTGTRLDHVMANIQTLKIAQEANVKAYIVDNHNKISLLSGKTVLLQEEAYGKRN